jgi:hypothetical protein
MDICTVGYRRSSNDRSCINEPPRDWFHGRRQAIDLELRVLLCLALGALAARFRRLYVRVLDDAGAEVYALRLTEVVAAR